jgi:hypothetical protein
MTDRAQVWLVAVVLWRGTVGGAVLAVWQAR